jgi:hypothetical protein
MYEQGGVVESTNAIADMCLPYSGTHKGIYGEEAMP